jgi:hypothetical protein
MKHLIYIFVAVILVMFAACDKNDKNVNETNANETENAYSDEEILAAVKFVGQGGLGYNDSQTSMFKAPNDVKILHIDLGKRNTDPNRPGGDCLARFGVCHLYILGWQIFNEVPITANENSISIPYSGSLDLSEIELFLAKEAGIDMRKVSLEVDEDIEIINISSGESYGTLAAQKAVFSDNLGEHGGFSLSVLSNE